MSDWLEKVHAYADGELGEKEAAEVERLLAEDTRAASEYQWAVYLRETLQSKAVRHEAEHVWQKCRERLDAIDAVRGDTKVEWFVGKFAWGMAALLFVIILAAGVLNRGIGGRQVSDQELAGLFTGAPFTQEQDVTGPSEANQILRQQLGADLPPIGPVYQITHAASGRMDGSPFMRLDLRDASGPLALYIFVGVRGIESFTPVQGRGEYTEGSVNGMSCVAWREGDIVYMLMSARTLDEMLSLADGMRR